MNRYPFTPAMAKFFGVKQGSGVLITQLSDEKGGNAETGPAAKAGIKPEDVVIAFDGKKIMNNQDSAWLLQIRLRAKGHCRVVRQGQEKDFEVTIAERTIENQENSKYTFEEPEEKQRPKSDSVLTMCPPRTQRIWGFRAVRLFFPLSPAALPTKQDWKDPDGIPVM
jgi:predicted metalloprotease with PDZ domain